jgi:hypothetical protein
MMTRKGMLLVLSVIALTSCAGQAVNKEVPDRLLVGTTVVLQQDLAVPAGHARVFLQQGRVVEKHRLDPGLPHCNFEQRTLSDGTAVIKADRFKVTAVSVGEDMVVQRDCDSMLPVGLREAGGSDCVDKVNRYINHQLFSPSQPQVMRLTCHGGFEVPGRAQLPGLPDIRTALGGVATLELP